IPSSRLSLHDALPILSFSGSWLIDGCASAPIMLIWALFQERYSANLEADQARYRRTAGSRSGAQAASILGCGEAGARRAVLWRRSEEHTSELQSRENL